ncbi:hypothetical protein, partial [Salmonella sp. C3210]
KFKADHRQVVALTSTNATLEASERALWSQWNRPVKGECMAVSGMKKKFGRNDAVLPAAGIAVTKDSKR